MHLIKEQALGEWLAESPGHHQGAASNMGSILFVLDDNGPFSYHLR